MATGLSDFPDLFMLSDVAADNQRPSANAAAASEQTGSFDFECFTRNSRDRGNATLAGFRPESRPNTPNTSPLRPADSEPPMPLNSSTQAADASEPSGGSIPSSEIMLQNALQVMQSLAGALQNTMRAPSQSERPRIKVDMPTYSGYHDRTSANEYLDRLQYYQQATGLSDAELLARVVPASLTEQAARWFRLAGHRARTVEEFRANFREEFLPANYEWRLRRELELRTQHPDESLLEYVRAMDELYRLASPLATDADKVERVTRQAHPTFAAYFRGCRYRDLDELATEAKRIQGDILAARAYRPPPPAALSLEPRCAWNGGGIASHSPRVDASASFADEQVQRGWELSDRALDPYAYALKTAQHNAARSAPRQELATNARTEERHMPTAERGSYGPPDWSDGRPRHRGFGGRCYQCGGLGHIARDCASTPGRGRARGSGNGRGRR